LGVVVGDAAHNVHTAVDHIVWQVAHLNVTARDAALQEGREWPPGIAQFPIFKAEEGFERDGRKKIACLCESHREQIEDIQPYKRSRVPHLRPLWLLYALSITDKHHVLNAAVRRLTELPDAPFRLIDVDPETGEPLRVYPNPNSPHRGVGVTVHPRFNEPGYITFEAEGKFPVEVAFSDLGSRFGRDIAGQPVAPLMDAVVAEVDAILATFDPAFER
jgi:hypothetical protein